MRVFVESATGLGTTTGDTAATATGRMPAVTGLPGICAALPTLTTPTVPAVDVLPVLFEKNKRVPSVAMSFAPGTAAEPADVPLILVPESVTALLASLISILTPMLRTRTYPRVPSAVLTKP